MAQLPPLVVRYNEYINVYAETGITPGTQIIIHNNGSAVAALYDSASEPDSKSGFDNIEPATFLTSSATPDGVWVKSNLGTILQVAEV